MATLSKLRQQTKFWMWIVGGAFILTIVFAWGMDYSGGSLATHLGKVNGEVITIQEYQDLYQANYRMQQQQMGGAEMEDALLEYLQEQTWQQLVSQKLIDQEIRRLHLAATDEEVRFAIQNYPPSEIQQIPDFQTDGIFDQQKYEAMMRNEAARGFWLQLEANMRSIIPEHKLQQLVMAAVTVTDEEARESYRYRNEKVTASYVALTPSAYPDTSVSVGDQEIRAYYQSHKEDYALPERADLNYVVLYKDASPADSSKVQQDLKDVQERLAAGDDFDTLARQYSDDTTAQNGGDLGWVSRGDMVKPFEDAAFLLRIGQISAPVQTQYGWHIIEVDSIRAGGTDAEQRKIRHILIQMSPSPTTLDSLRGKLEALRNGAVEEDFTTSATRLGLQVQQTGPIEAGGFVPGIGFEPGATKFAIANPVGSVSEIMENASMFYLLQVRDRFPAGTSPLEDVRDQIESTLVHDKTLESLHQQSDALATQLKKRPDRFQALADEMGYDVGDTGPFTRNDYVSGIGRDPSFIAAAFATPAGGVAGPIKGEDGWYILKVTEHSDVSSDQLKSVIDAEKQQLLSSRRQSAFNQWLSALRNRAKIVDNRSNILG